MSGTNPFAFNPVDKKDRLAFRVFWIFYLVLLLAGILVVLLFSKTESFLWINGHHHSIADIFFRYVTFLGDGLFHVLLVVFFLWTRRFYGWIGLWSFITSSLFAQLLKRLIFHGSPRPLAVLKDPSLIHFVQGVTVHSADSFPSGHTATAFSIALWISYIYRNPWVSVISLLLAAAVAYSRVYLAQHFVADVVAGSIIGVLSTFLVIWLIKKRSKAVSIRT